MNPITTLPKPAGPYQVGCTHLNYVDETRVDPSPQAGGKRRDIPVRIWYPVDDPAGRLPAKLMKRQDLASLKQYFLYRFITSRICDIVTNSHPDAPLSCQNARFPALIFNHGFSSYMEQNTILMEHLASFGYIVVSVGHPYDGVASYPDGRSIPVDLGLIKGLSKEARQNQKIFKESLKQLARDDLSIAEMRQYTANYLYASKAMNDRIEIWVEDIRFIADVLEKLDQGLIASMFIHKLALKKGIGVFGQSYGGAASILACCLDARLKCGVNIDGAMYGGINEKYQYKQPTMYMESDMLPGRSRYFFNINEGDTYQVIIKGSKHLDYSDFSYISKHWLLKLLQMVGHVDGSLMINITNEYVRSFFDKYIKQIDAPLFEQNPYPEVVFEKRTGQYLHTAHAMP